MHTERSAWSALPLALRRLVGEMLGGPVTAFVPATGGFSVGGVVGVAGNVTDRVFVKAVPADHDAAPDYRIEGRVAAALPAGVPTPRLRAFQEGAGWVLLAFDAVEGRPAAEPWTDEDLAAALEALTRTAHALTPAPAVDVPTVAQRMAGRCETWRELERSGRCGPVREEQLPAWERAHLPRLAALEDAWPALLTGGSLLHFDLRHDNVLVTGHDSSHGTGPGAVVVDWGRACTGPAWVDLVCLLLESDLGGRDPERLFPAHPLGREAEATHVDAFLAALASYWTHAAALPPPRSAAHLRARQEQSRRRTVSWLARRRR